MNLHRKVYTTAELSPAGSDDYITPALKDRFFCITVLIGLVFVVYMSVKVNVFEPLFASVRNRDISGFILRPTLRELFSEITGKAVRNERIVQAHLNHGCTLKEITDHPGIHYTTVSKIVNGQSKKWQSAGWQPEFSIIEEMTNTIVETAKPRKVISLGFRARGAARDESDVDIVVIEEEPFDAHRSRRKEMARLWQALSRFYLAKDILVYASEEEDKWKESRNHILAQALKFGRVLYERR